MNSDNHIGKLVNQHADAVENGKANARKRKAKKAKATQRKSFTSVFKHRAFIPLVTVWGAVLMALVISVLPDFAIASASALTGVYVPLIAARMILALGIGLCGGLLGFIVASALSNRAKKKEGDGRLVSAAFKSRGFQPINPSIDLGSDSLDAPIEPEIEVQEAEFEPAVQEFARENAPLKQPPLKEAAVKDRKPNEPTLGELAQRGFDIDAPQDSETTNASAKKSEWAFTRKHFKDALIESCEGATCEAAPGLEVDGSKAHEPRGESEFATLSAEQITPHPKPPSDKPKALDLGEFAAMPGRDAVWVDEQVVREPLGADEAKFEEAGGNLAPQDKLAPQGNLAAQEQISTKTALETLRATPTDDLSLVQMVERFAAALQDHQDHERSRLEAGSAVRETALAEALKALALFTDKGFDRGDAARLDDGQINQTESELRGALARLQQLRGAA